MERWLSLAVTAASPVKFSGAFSKKALRISAPKKVVRSAVRRNRLRRLIREVLRSEHSLDPGRLYWFKIRREPAKPDYKMVQKAIQEIWNGQK